MVLVVFARHRRWQHRNHDFGASQSYETDSVRERCAVVPGFQRAKNIGDVEAWRIRHSQKETLVNAYRCQGLPCLDLANFSYRSSLLVADEITSCVTAGRQHNRYSAVLVENCLRQITGDGRFIVRVRRDHEDVDLESLVRPRIVRLLRANRAGERSKREQSCQCQTRSAHRLEILKLRSLRNELLSLVRHRTINQQGAVMRRVLLCVCTVLACTGKSEAGKSGDSAIAAPAQADRPIAVVHDGLASAEAVSFDPVRDVYFVSNINGDPGIKDGNGFITRITADGVVDSLHFIQGGRNGVALNAPMGSRVQGDTLWVLDVDVLRGFNARTGAPVKAIDLAPAGAGFLNDLTVGPDGDFYITDTGVRPVSGNLDHVAPDRIYHVDRSRKVSIALQTPALAMPDGIGWDPGGKRVVLAPFGGKAVQEWHPGDQEPRDVAPGPSKFDGVEVQPSGSIVITIWNDSSVSTLEGNQLVKHLRLSMPPADASVDTKRGRVGVVSVAVDRFELWPWPGH